MTRALAVLSAASSILLLSIVCHAAVPTGDTAGQYTLTERIYDFGKKCHGSEETVCARETTTVPPGSCPYPYLTFHNSTRAKTYTVSALDHFSFGQDWTGRKWGDHTPNLNSTWKPDCHIQFYAEYKGDVDAPVAGLYHFTAHDVDDWLRVEVDGAVAVEFLHPLPWNCGTKLCSPQTPEADIPLNAGPHHLRILCFEGYGWSGLDGGASGFQLDVALSTATLAVTQFQDANMNGVQDNGEPDLPGWQVSYSGPSSGTGGTVLQAQLAPGAYTVSDAPRDGWTCTTPDNVALQVSSGTTAAVAFGSVCLGSITVRKFSDDNMNGIRDSGELGIASWPVRLEGTAINGTHVGPIDAVTVSDADPTVNGTCRFGNLVPGTYRISEEGSGIAWGASSCDMKTVWNGEHRLFTGATLDGQPSPFDACATTLTAPAVAGVEVNCNDRIVEFGDVCLTTIDGMVQVCDDGPVGGGGTASPGAGWEVCLAGTDRSARDVRPCDSNGLPLPPASKAPAGLASESSVWYTATCDENGRFCFTDLPPGHYELMEQSDPSYRLVTDKPLASGFDLECRPMTTLLTNIRKDIPSRVYQVYPGKSSQCHVMAVPGVLQIVPGEDWRNFVQATQLGYEYQLKNVVLAKDSGSVRECADVFKNVQVRQQGAANIRTWWPLMYEPPGTTWTLTVTYGTKTQVQLPGETAPGYVHEDVWQWMVDTDVPHMKLFLDLLHELPFGTGQVPLISDEFVFQTLQGMLSDIDALITARDRARGGLALSYFELEVMDACIGESPPFPRPTGPGMGIAETLEDPACCQLLVDADYVGRTSGVYMPVK